MPARSVCLVTLSLSEAGPGRFGRQVSVTEIYHTMPYPAAHASRPLVHLRRPLPYHAIPSTVTKKTRKAWPGIPPAAVVAMFDSNESGSQPLSFHQRRRWQHRKHPLPHPTPPHHYSYPNTTYHY